MPNYELSIFQTTTGADQGVCAVLIRIGQETFRATEPVRSMVAAEQQAEALHQRLQAGDFSSLHPLIAGALQQVGGAHA